MNSKKTSDPLIAQKRTKQLELQQSNNQKITAIENPDYTGFAARLEALSRLTQGSSSLWLANLFIIFLFIAIETAPVLVKLISSRGPYDHMLASIEYSHKLGWIKEKARQHTKLRKEADKYSRREKEMIEQYLSSDLT